MKSRSNCVYVPYVHLQTVQLSPVAAVGLHLGVGTSVAATVFTPSPHMV